MAGTSSDRAGAAPPPEVNLENCEHEPIHIPGAVQPHGMLVAFDAVGKPVITYASENAAKVIGVPADRLIGSDVAALFDPTSTVAAALSSGQLLEARPTYLHTVSLAKTKGVFDAIAHRNGDNVILEFEPADQPREFSAPELYRLVQGAIVRLQRTSSIDEIVDVCAEQVRLLTGFDRVMVYRFDADWNGQVVAERHRAGLEPFLGLNYPASDIPRQARELYTRNWLRFIPDRDYAPARVLASPAKATVPLDMSHAVLRSVSPIHIEYLRNMGVRASMSVSLIRDGRLWGLIACHHYDDARFVPYDIRTACELLGQFMSMHLATAEQRGLATARDRAKRVRKELLANVEHFEDETRALIASQPTMLDLITADGAAVVVEGRHVSRIGQTPGEAEILGLASWLDQVAKDDVYATDHLASKYGSAVLGAVAAGVLAISISATRSLRLLWFRTERVRTVDWAGDPAKSVTKGEGDARLSPRGSFALWKETVRGRSLPWTDVELQTAQLMHDNMMRLLLKRTRALAAAHDDLRLASEEKEKALDSERAARAEAERLNRMKDEFVATLSHELRTPLNAILGWAQILMRRGGMEEELSEGLKIIERNARSQTQMIGDLLDISRIVAGKMRLDLRHTHLPSVIESAIETVSLAAAAKDIRIERMLDPLIGLETTGDPNRIQQVVWNLLSNAVKFTPRGGKVQVVLERVASHVELSVADTGQGISPEFLPHVFDRFRQGDASSNRTHGGLGLGLAIVRNLVEMHGGSVRAFSAGDGRGSTFVVSLPVRVMQRPKDTKPQPHPTSDGGALIDCERLNLAGVRVLVVDDEPDARGLIRRMLEDCQCVVATAGSKAEALTALEAEPFDVIVSDIGMPKEDGLVLMRAWRAREAETGRTRVPAIALTAYVRAEDRRRSIMSGFQAHLGKPVEAGELLAQVASLAGRV